MGSLPFTDLGEAFRLLDADPHLRRTTVASYDGRHGHISQQHMAVPALWSAAADDPLKAGLESLFHAMVTVGIDYRRLLSEVRDAAILLMGGKRCDVVTVFKDVFTKIPPIYARDQEVLRICHPVLSQCHILGVPPGADWNVSGVDTGFQVPRSHDNQRCSPEHAENEIVAGEIICHAR